MHAEPYRVCTDNRRNVVDHRVNIIFYKVLMRVGAMTDPKTPHY